MMTLIGIELYKDRDCGSYNILMTFSDIGKHLPSESFRVHTYVETEFYHQLGYLLNKYKITSLYDLFKISFSEYPVPHWYVRTNNVAAVGLTIDVFDDDPPV